LYLVSPFVAEPLEPLKPLEIRRSQCPAEASFAESLQHPDGTHTTATTNKDKAEVLFRSLYPDAKGTPLEEPTAEYPPPAFEFTPPTNEQMNAAILRLSAKKAPGPDSIPNKVWTKCRTSVAPWLGALWQAMFALKYIPPRWQEEEIVFLRKPGKPSYADPSAWRPISKKNTSEKLGPTATTALLMDSAERLDMLPHTQFGGHAGRTAADALLHVTSFASKAMAEGDVAGALLLDVQAAFPSVSIAVLIHKLRCQGVPCALAEWYATMLADRPVTLSFDGQTSHTYSPNCGLAQGCPSLAALFLFYNTPLLKEINTENNENAAGFMDDVTFLARGDTAKKVIEILTNIMERPRGALHWSDTHQSKFSIPKFALMIFVAKTFCQTTTNRQR
jgi:hypothetical protein